MSSVFFDVGCGAKTCILIRDDQANQGNVNDPDVDDWLLINGAYKNPTLLNNNIPSNKYVMGSYFCGSGIGRDNRALGKYPRQREYKNLASNKLWHVFYILRNVYYFNNKTRKQCQLSGRY